MTWYPDDSEEWIEIDLGERPDLPNGTIIQVLSDVEREHRNFHDLPLRVEAWKWELTYIVAYKVIK